MGNSLSYSGRAVYMKHKSLTKIPKNLKFSVDKCEKHDIMATVVSQADVAELVYAHDSGSCEHCARAGSSPAICTKAFLETETLFLRVDVYF